MAEDMVSVRTLVAGGGTADFNGGQAGAKLPCLDRATSGRYPTDR